MPQKFVENFRFSERYEDVFAYENELVYVCAEPFDEVWPLSCTAYVRHEDNSYSPTREFGADAEWITSLPPVEEVEAFRLICIVHATRTDLLRAVFGTKPAERN